MQVRTAQRTSFLRRTLPALVIALAVASQSLPAYGEDAEAAREAGMGAAAALSTLVYGPAKIVYAVVGGIVSGMAWIWTGGDSDVASPIFIASVRGDYVVTPDHLTGRRTLEFVGRPPAERRSEQFAGSRYEEGF